ncbi:DUF4920 domain-containing protein [Ferrimonas marina]|uniref:DUF4920 domain-containing protein n=1 Tax=Ferrimonas marina TaxID=299255 RepID=A0A1M5N2I5_9GAMM|nr:DUF4920 domain-containing protein [Ferrimonas marina]SHG83213.1 protein of unknown function [Ferrimonas marina]
MSLRRWTLMLALGCSLPLAADPLTFGEPVDAAALVPMSQVMADPDAYLADPITVQGTIEAVCKKRGCWMTLVTEADPEGLRVKVKDGVMEFPVSAKGRPALATGQLQKQQMDLDTTRRFYAHQAEEQGESFDPQSVQEPLTYYQLAPTAVLILDR